MPLGLVPVVTCNGRAKAQLQGAVALQQLVAHGSRLLSSGLAQQVLVPFSRVVDFPQVWPCSTKLLAQAAWRHAALPDLHGADRCVKDGFTVRQPAGQAPGLNAWRFRPRRFGWPVLLHADRNLRKQSSRSMVFCRLQASEGREILRDVPSISSKMNMNR
jgi:hypothetical protein